MTAHAHAYGGAIIQDMGLLSIRKQVLQRSNALHKPSGDFVEALIRHSQDINEYAFAIGALCHYSADTDGHSIATNPLVPILYPNYANSTAVMSATDESPTAHIRTEFGFEMAYRSLRDTMPRKHTTTLLGSKCRSRCSNARLRKVCSRACEHFFARPGLPWDLYRT